MPHGLHARSRRLRAAGIAALAGVAGVTGLGVGWLLLVRADPGGGGEPAGDPDPASAGVPAARPRPMLPGPAERIAAVRPGDPERPPRADRPAASAPRAPWQGLDLPPPPPPNPGDPPAGPPALPPVDRDAEVARLAAALELLRDARARTEELLVDREGAGDEAGADRARIRLARLARAEERRAEELERARRGEPSPHARDTPDTAVEPP